jgi:hypothetical protein
VLWIRICFNADPDPGSQTNADPDPGQTLKLQSLILHEKDTYSWYSKWLKNIPAKAQKPF